MDKDTFYKFYSKINKIITGNPQHTCDYTNQDLYFVILTDDQTELLGQVFSLASEFIHLEKENEDDNT